MGPDECDHARVVTGGGVRAMRTMGAAKAKAQFLGLLDEVAARREPVVVTKNGVPVAKMVPMPLETEDPIFGFLKGKMEIVGDILSPTHTDEEYEEFFNRSAAQINDPA